VASSQAAKKVFVDGCGWRTTLESVGKPSHLTSCSSVMEPPAFSSKKMRHEEGNMAQTRISAPVIQANDDTFELSSKN